MQARLLGPWYSTFRPSPARVKATIEIEAELAEDAPDSVVRTVSENARTLHFKTFGFEEV